MFPERPAEPRARLERLRCAIARDLFINHLWGVKLALKVVPRYHPWRTLVASSTADLIDLTRTTLRPRDDLGRPQVKVVVQNAARRLLSPVLAIKIVLLYALIDLASVRVPGPLSGSSWDESIRIIERVGSAASAFMAG